MKDKKPNGTRRTLSTSLLLLLVALVFVTAGTAAWFSISDNTRLYSINMDITAGAALRFDLDPHPDISQYVRTLSFSQIADRIARDYGNDPREGELVPVTTENYSVFTLRNGTVKPSDSGAYLEFTLHFMAAEDMYVHLTSANSRRAEDGTLITSAIPQLPDAMRISFTIGTDVMVYDPGMGPDAESSQHNFGFVKVFGLPSADAMVYNEQNSMFFIKAYKDLPVVVHIWMEGSDPACTDLLRGGDYSIRLRFEGTDENNVPMTDLYAYRNRKREEEYD